MRCQNEFTGLSDRACRISIGNVCKRVKGEIRVKFATILLDEFFPHEAGCGVVGEGKVDRAVEKLLEVLLRSIMGLGGTTDDSNASLISDPLLPPLRQSLLNPHRVT